jgi:hypothetical protein
MEDKIKSRTGRDPQRGRHHEICEVLAAGHMEWMDEERMPRKLHGRTGGRRRRGRPRKRWLQSLEEDLRIMRVGKRWEKVGCREEWGSIVREAKAHPGL